MAFTLHIELGYEFAVKADVDTVFDTLADVPRSASHYPKVARLVDLGEATYRWEMDKIGLGQVHFQTIYTSRYESDRAAGVVRWAPLADGGNALVSGNWAIKKGKKGTRLQLQIDADLTLPLPGLMKPMLTGLITAEFESLTEQYIANLCTHFGGEVPV